MRGLAIARTQFATRAPRLPLGPIFGERRRLPIAGASRGLELVAQPFVFTPQRRALALCAFRALAQRVDLVALSSRIGRLLIRHADVMPDLRETYKYGFLD